MLISIHALLAESDPHKQNKRRHIPYFYPRSPCGERQGFGLAWLVACVNFYPRSPCGERPSTMTTTTCIVSFLSTLSLRRATNINSSVTTADKISIHALLAESDMSMAALRQALSAISIHALLAESDLNPPKPRRFHYHFYPRSPCGERRPFLPFWSLSPYFYPRSPCGERP